VVGRVVRADEMRDPDRGQEDDAAGTTGGGGVSPAPSGTRCGASRRSWRYASMTTGMIIGRRRCDEFTHRPTVRRTTCA
jgi:hypothetical protein